MVCTNVPGLSMSNKLMVAYSKFEMPYDRSSKLGSKVDDREMGLLCIFVWNLLYKNSTLSSPSFVCVCKEQQE